jgi:hypothetical protein
MLSSLLDMKCKLNAGVVPIAGNLLWSMVKMFSSIQTFNRQLLVSSAFNGINKTISPVES